MERFLYKARTKEGALREGKVEARDMTSAVGILRERGMVVVNIHGLNELSGITESIAFLNKIKFDDVVTFTRQFSTMIASGLALTEALSILELQSSKPLAKVLGEVLRDIQGGTSLGDALDKHRDAFSGVYVSLIRAGEASGSLDKVLLRLAETMEKQKEFKAKIKGAMIYPVIVVIGMMIVATIMMVFVVPKLAAMYEDFGAELPFATRALIAVSDFVSRFWILAIVAAVAGYFGLIYWRRTPKGQMIYDSNALKLPVFGKLTTQVTLAEMTRTLSLLLGAGISLLKALEIVSGVISNELFRGAFRISIKGVKKGVPLSVTLARQEVFPPLLPNMVAVGEETGKMDEVLERVANYFETEAEHTVKNLTTALEPLIMIVLGVGVAFLVLSIIMPIYNLTNQF